MRYLVIGISIITAATSPFACIKKGTMVDYGYYTTYVYDNKSGIGLKMMAYHHGELINEWSISSGQQITIGPLVSEYPVPFHSYYLETKGKYEDSDSIVVEFANSKCLFYTLSDISHGSILVAEHYQGFREVEVENPTDGNPIFNPTRFTLTWTVTPDDVVQAIDCDML